MGSIKHAMFQRTAIKSNSVSGAKVGIARHLQRPLGDGGSPLCIASEDERTWDRLYSGTPVLDHSCR